MSELARRYAEALYEVAPDEETLRATSSMPSFMTRPTTFPPEPTRNAARRATIPVPQATSSTCSSGPGAASSTKYCAPGANKRGTR